MDRLRSYRIYCDDVFVMTINHGRQVEFEVGPGLHRLELRIDWCRSNSVEFEDSGLIEFECGNCLRGAAVFLAAFFVAFRTSEYLWLRRVDR